MTSTPSLESPGTKHKFDLRNRSHPPRDAGLIGVRAARRRVGACACARTGFYAPCVLGRFDPDLNDIKPTDLATMSRGEVAGKYYICSALSAIPECSLRGTFWEQSARADGEFLIDLIGSGC